MARSFDDEALERMFVRTYRAGGLNSATLAAGFGLAVTLLFELFDWFARRPSLPETVAGGWRPEWRLLIAPLLAGALYLGLRHREWVLRWYVLGIGALAALLLLAFAVPPSSSTAPGSMLAVPVRPVVGLYLLIFFVFAFLRLPGPVTIGLGSVALAAHLWSATSWPIGVQDLPTLIGLPVAAALAGLLLSQLIEARERRLYLAAIRAQSIEQGRAQRIDEFVHDLRGPLAALDVELRRMPDLMSPAARVDIAADVDRRLRSVVDELGWVRDHLEDLSRWNKGDEPHVPLRVGPLSVSQLVDWIRSQFEAQCRDQQVALKIRLDAGLDERELSTNRSAIYSVVLNLVGNAIKYRDPAKGAQAWVKVEFSEQAQFCVIRVSDNGIGIGADELQRIWQPGYRSPRSMMTSEGSGLGLSIARERIERLAAHSLSARSTLGQGSQFTIRIPWLEQAPATLTGAITRTAGASTITGTHFDGDEAGVNTSTAGAAARTPVSRVLVLAPDACTLTRVSALLDPHNVFVDEASSTRALRALLNEGDSTYDYMVIAVTKPMNVSRMIREVRRDHGFDVPAIIRIPFWRWIRVRSAVERQIPEVRCVSSGWFGDRMLRRYTAGALARSLALQARVIGNDR